MSHFLAAQAVATQLAEEVEQDLDVEQASSDQYFVERQRQYEEARIQAEEEKVRLEELQKEKEQLAEKVAKYESFSAEYQRRIDEQATEWELKKKVPYGGTI